MASRPAMTLTATVLDAAAAHAVAAGATLAAYQPQDKVPVHLDPAGHPFCLWTP